MCGSADAADVTRQQRVEAGDVGYPGAWVPGLWLRPAISSTQLRWERVIGTIA